MEQYMVYNAENNGQTLVVLPALGERKEIYAPLAAQMETVRIIAIDLPGHNREDRADADIGAFVQEIKDILDELQISEAHLVGNSIGAWICEAFYAEYPAYVKSLTLLDGGYYFLADREEDEGRLRYLSLIVWRSLSRQWMKPSWRWTSLLNLNDKYSRTI